MTAGRPAVACGEVALYETQLRERIDATDAGVDVAGRVVPILDRDRVNALVTALAVRGAGGVPLIGDDRWDSRYWEGLRRTVQAAGPVPGVAWATFTSGSTGTPRVIVRTDRSWSASFPGVTRLLGLTAEDTVYLPSPLVSSVTMFSVAHARAAGATILLPRTHTVSDPDLARATVLHGTPYALRDIVERVEAGADHRLRVALVGGARLDPRLRERAQAAGIRVVSYYGAAELSFVAVDPDGHGLRPFDGVETRVIDGVLWVRSAYFASGYLDVASEGRSRALAEASTANAYPGPLRRDGDGWGTVGDLVDAGPAGQLRLRGRSDGAILTAAATVVPEDVEAALQRIDGIADAVVFGLPNARAGALVAAVIEMVPGRRPPSARELRERSGPLLSATHRPRRWFWIERLPRTTSGKPARQLIRRAVIEGTVTRID